MTWANLSTAALRSAWQSPWSAGFYSKLATTEIPHVEDDLIGKSMIAVNGMKSPSLFAPNLQELARQGMVSLSTARDIPTAVRMFLANRAPLLWGSDDFSWYFEKINGSATYIFAPRVSSSVVVWVRKEKTEVLERLNEAFKSLKAAGSLDEKGILKDDLMRQRYKDAPFTQ